MNTEANNCTIYGVRRMLSMTKQRDLYRWKIWSVLCFAFLIGFFHRYSIAVVADNLSIELGLTGVHLSNLASMYFYAYALLQLPVGILADIIGPRKITFFGMILAASGSLIFGLTNTIFIIYTARLLVGIGVSTIFVAILKILSNWFYPHEFTTFTGYTSLIGNIGGLIATTPFALLVIAIGWRTSFLAISILSFVVALLIWLIVRDTPQEKGWEPVVAPEEKISRMEFINGFKKIVFNKQTWPNFFAMFGIMGPFMSISGLWGVPYMMHTYNLPKNSASNYILVLTLGFIIGASVIGKVDKLIRNRNRLIQIATGAFATLMGYIVFIEKGNPPIRRFPIIFFAAGVFCVFLMLTMTNAKEANDPKFAGIVTGLLNIAPFIGTATLNTLVGWRLDATWTGNMLDGARMYHLASYQQAFFIYFLFALLSFSMSLCMRKKVFMQDDVIKQTYREGIKGIEG